MLFAHAIYEDGEVMKKKSLEKNDLKSIACCGPKGHALDSNVEAGAVPSTIKNQNLGHNSKKEGMGPNTKR